MTSSSRTSTQPARFHRKFSVKQFAVTLFTLALLATQSAFAQANDPRYSAAADFSTGLNPNGVWSYGWSNSVGGPFQLFTTHGQTFISGEVGWFGSIPGATAPGFPLVVAGFVPGPPVLDLGAGPSTFAVARWTAPSAGRWDFVGKFEGTGGNTSDAHVLSNGVEVFNTAVNDSDTHYFSLSLQLNQGETVDFVGGPGPNGNYDFDAIHFGVIVSLHRFDFRAVDFPGATSTRVFGINNGGDVVGEYLDSNKARHGFRLSQGNYTSIDPAGSVSTSVRGITGAGEIVGFFKSSTDNLQHGFVIKNGEITVADLPGALNTAINGVNQRGDVTGTLDIDGVNAQGFLTTRIGTVIFDGPAALFGTTSSNGINNRGQVVGTSVDVVDPNPVHGFLRMDANNIVKLDFPGTDQTFSTGINDTGSIVGHCFCLEGLSHGWILRQGNYIVVDYPAFNSATRVRGINNGGEVVGFYQLEGQGQFHGFVGTPVQ